MLKVGRNRRMGFSLSEVAIRSKPQLFVVTSRMRELPASSGWRRTRRARAAADLDYRCSPGLGDGLPLRLGRRRSSSLATQAHLLGQFRSLGSIVRSNHRIVSWKAPFCPVFRRRHVAKAKVPLHRLELAAIFERNDVVRRHRFLDGNGRRLRGGHFHLPRGSQASQRVMHAADQVRQRCRRKGVLRDISADDVGRGEKE